MNAVSMTGKAPGYQPGFTIVELIATLIVAGILAAVVVPRFFGSTGFEERGLYDETVSALRYAQKTAIAQRRLVCVRLEAKKITLRVASSYGVVSCNTDLTGPDGKRPYLIDATENTKYGNANVQFSGLTLGGVAAGFPTELHFRPSGSPSSAATITIANFGSAITVEAETGYVH